MKKPNKKRKVIDRESECSDFKNLMLETEQYISLWRRFFSLYRTQTDRIMRAARQGLINKKSEIKLYNEIEESSMEFLDQELNRLKKQKKINNKK